MISFAAAAIRSAGNAYEPSFTHVLLDEAQDTSEAQYQLLQVAVPEGRISLTAVGDSNQTICAFRPFPLPCTFKCCAFCSHFLIPFAIFHSFICAFPCHSLVLIVRFCSPTIDATRLAPARRIHFHSFDFHYQIVFVALIRTCSPALLATGSAKSCSFPPMCVDFSWH